MREIATDVWQLEGWPKNAINKYVIGDVLVDAGAAYEHRTVVKQARAAGVTAHALTHAHVDHYGGSSHVLRDLGIPLWVGADDAEAVRRGRQVAHIPGRGKRLVWAGAKACPVDRELVAGDKVAGFEVIETPGHSPGHISFWRESDRVLLLGDVVWGWHAFRISGAPRAPWDVLTPDPALNRDSARKLAQLDPAVICFGHGPVMRDADAFQDVVGGFR